MSHVTVVTQDLVGERMAGPAIRAVELARCLSNEHDVVLLARHPSAQLVPGVRVESYEPDGTALRAAARRTDVIVAFGSLLIEHPWLADAGPMIVADLYDPAFLEALAMHVGEDLDERWRQCDGSMSTLLAQIDLADTFLCASERQRHLLTGLLAARGRVNPATYDDDPTLDALVRVVPFGVSADPARPSLPGERPLRDLHPAVDEGDLLLLWGGGLYEWLDPIAAVDLVGSVPDLPVRMIFMGTAHPTPEVARMPVANRLCDRARSLGLLGDRVLLLEGWVPYGQRSTYLCDADVGVSLHHQHVETTFAFRTRLLDYLWAGLPILCSSGDVLSELIHQAGAGEVVRPGDAPGLVRALRRLADPEQRSAMAEASADLGRAFHWDQIAGPLVELCRSPRRAPDRDRTQGHAPSIRADLRRLARSVRHRLSRGWPRLTTRPHTGCGSIRRDRC